MASYSYPNMSNWETKNLPNEKHTYRLEGYTWHKILK
nr:MAG TPA: hypothetical protein [Caudoviricetes sp.]